VRSLDQLSIIIMCTTWSHCMVVLLAVVVSTQSRTLNSGVGFDDLFQHLTHDDNRSQSIADVTTKGSERVLIAVLGSLERGLDFMKKNANSLNLDAIIGTRIVEGLCGILDDVIYLFIYLFIYLRETIKHILHIMHKHKYSMELLGTYRFTCKH